MEKEAPGMVRCVQQTFNKPGGKTLRMASAAETTDFLKSLAP